MHELLMHEVGPRDKLYEQPAVKLNKLQITQLEV
jgi:hypothetical protein